MCFAFEGRVAVGDKADGINAELEALGAVVVQDNHGFVTKEKRSRLQEMADECRDEDSQANTPGLDTIIQGLLPPNKKLKREATQAKLNAKPTAQYRRQRKKGSQLEAFANIIKDGNRKSRLGRGAPIWPGFRAKQTRGHPSANRAL